MASQSKAKSLAERRGEFLKDESTSDITLTVGVGDDEKQSFRAHKAILAASSDVFKQMFYGQLAKTEKDFEKGVEIVDIQPDIFNQLLSYVYADKFDVGNTKDAILLHKAANKYMIDSLVERCLENLVKNTNSANALNILEYANFIDNYQLVSFALQHMSTKVDEFLNSDVFYGMQVSIVKSLLREFDFKCKEVIIFRAVLNYAMLKMCKDGQTHEDQLKSAKEYLIEYDLLQGIQISTLTAEDFLKSGTNLDMFSYEERFHTLSYIDGCKLILPPFFNADHRRPCKTQELQTPVDDKIKISNFLAMPVIYIATATFGIDKFLPNGQDYPHNDFECKFLIDVSTNVYLSDITLNTVNMGWYEISSVRLTGSWCNGYGDFYGKALDSLLQCKFEFVTQYKPYFLKIGFRVKPNPTLAGLGATRCYKFETNNAVLRFGDNSPIATVSVDASGWTPSTIALTFTVKKESAFVRKSAIDQDGQYRGRVRRPGRDQASRWAQRGEI